jgi:hypothetical protein
MATNPLIGSGWSSTPQPMDNSGQSGLFGQGPIPPSGAWGNPGGYGNPRGGREIQRNAAFNNIIAGQYKNQLAPQWEALFKSGGSDAMNFFRQLMNQGSPYYQQKQAEAFRQGVGQNQNAMADAQQRLQQQGYGSTPSGANAAMIGGMESAGANNLAEQYLQNLFQNEQMQMAGAQGVGQTAQMFNPTQMLGGTSIGSDINIPSSFAQNFASIGQGIGGMFGGASNAVKKVMGGG